MLRLSRTRLPICSAVSSFTNILGRVVYGRSSTSVRSSLKELLHTWVHQYFILCVLSLNRVSAGFTFSSVRNLTILPCATAQVTTCPLIVIAAYKKQIESQRNVVTIQGILSSATSRLVLF